MTELLNTQIKQKRLSDVMNHSFESSISYAKEKINEIRNKEIESLGGTKYSNNRQRFNTFRFKK